MDGLEFLSFLPPPSEMYTTPSAFMVQGTQPRIVYAGQTPYQLSYNPSLSPAFYQEIFSCPRETLKPVFLIHISLSSEISCS